MIIGLNGTVLGTGNNADGQLGIGSAYNTRSSFVSHATSVMASQIAAGSQHTMIIIKPNGTVAGAGNNGYGALGLGYTSGLQTSFVSHSTPVEASQISCGGGHSIIIRNDGKLATTGLQWDGVNVYGQLGINQSGTQSVTSFTNCVPSTDAIILFSPSSTAETTFAITTDNSLVAAGRNEKAQLGTGDNIYKYSMTSVTDNIYTILKPLNISLAKIELQNLFNLNAYQDDELRFGYKYTKAILKQNGDLSIVGNLSKAGGTFNIPHPLPSMKDSHRLLHSFIEGPKMDLVYRGLATLTNGFASVDIDEVSNMTKGTFQALTRDVQCFTTNETNWEKVKGKIKDNKLSIQSNNPVSNIEVNWLIMGERNDDYIKKSIITDDEGNLIVEPLKGII